jgi:hypothetical protein
VCIPVILALRKLRQETQVRGQRGLHNTTQSPKMIGVKNGVSRDAEKMQETLSVSSRYTRRNPENRAST